MRWWTMTVVLLGACGGSGGGEPDATTGCADDAECDDGLFCNGQERCVGSICVPTPSCVSDLQTCDEALDRCFTDCDATADADGDGARAIECGGNDCDDANPDRRPGAVEVCDVAGVDEDCDPSTYGFRDMDGDGLGDAACCNGDECGRDCDDGDAAVSPRSPESCNGFDDDCDGSVDEGVLVEFYVDADGDGFGAAGSDASLDCRQRIGFAPTPTDCDDDAPTVNPGAVEVCDGETDEDCSGEVDDVPGGCTCDEGTEQDCGLDGRCEGATQRCEGGRWGTCTIRPIAESCNETDDDCDGMVDEGQTVRCFFDGDNDGVASFGAPPSDQCPAADGGCPVFYTEVEPSSPADGDCDDSRALQSESKGCFADTDGDGFGAGAAVETVCLDDPCPDGLVESDTDCCPSAANGFPGSTAWSNEVSCGTTDVNCDGVVERRYGFFSCNRNAIGICQGGTRGPSPYLRDDVGCGTISVEVDTCSEVDGVCRATWSGFAGSGTDIRTQQCR